MNLGLYALAVILVVGTVLTIVIYSLFFFRIMRKQPPESENEISS
jgi:hypothetical protein